MPKKRIAPTVAADTKPKTAGKKVAPKLKEQPEAEKRRRGEGPTPPFRSSGSAPRPAAWRPSPISWAASP